MRPRSLLRGLSVSLGALLLVAVLGSSASAQVPALPDTPDIPAPVTDAVSQVQGTVVPLMVQGAVALQPAANAVGFLLRPGCSGAGSAIVVAALLPAVLPLPVSPGLALTPVFIACGAAFEEGPADPVFAQVDAAAGPQIQDTAGPLMAQVSSAIAPARSTLSEACTAAALFGSAPDQLPPPINRLGLVAAVCG